MPIPLRASRKRACGHPDAPFSAVEEEKCSLEANTVRGLDRIDYCVVCVGIYTYTYNNKVKKEINSFGSNVIDFQY